jgi:hypothetical protein
MRGHLKADVGEPDCAAFSIGMSYSTYEQGLKVALVDSHDARNFSVDVAYTIGVKKVEDHQSVVRLNDIVVTNGFVLKTVKKDIASITSRYCLI